MQFQGDDMDNLFRRAAEDYPLNTHTADWQKVQAMLSAGEEPLPPKDSNWQLSWLLLLLPVTFLCNHLSDGLYRPAAAGTTAVTIASQQMKQQPAAAEKDMSDYANAKGPAQKQTAARAKRSFNFIPLKQENSAKNYAPVAQRKEIVVTEKTGRHNRQNRQPETLPLQSQTAVAALSISNAVEHIEVKNAADVLTRPIVALPGRKNSVVPDTALQFAKHPSTQKTSAIHRQRLYAGVVAGPDLSTVRFERFSQVGFQAGILLGYRISQRFAVEAGALSSKKYYYSEGDYVRSTKVYRSPNSDLLSADGNCRMLELPVVLQYTISKNAAHAWYAAAGVSSYLMKKEDYTYAYKNHNTGNVVLYNKMYTNQTKNWLSLLQLRVGRNAKLGSFGSLRVESYYAIPLKGIGYGELPLSSLGLRIGVTSPHF